MKKSISMSHPPGVLIQAHTKTFSKAKDDMPDNWLSSNQLILPQHLVTARMSSPSNQN
jgi:hypothetical protein